MKSFKKKQIISEGNIDIQKGVKRRNGNHMNKYMNILYLNDMFNKNNVVWDQ